ncbi:hypothetical protein [Brumimicrobium oceani]|uniref:Outer membrane protein beta-barrel domain-containing protein n=1 Tax=Brumimicrobium oceani TaxID=2100725 RepID=A0A2U2XCK9_9FLAO|nr:hypothetical protein [Brumimicrobium oceani]PWH85503.1 hypothetical protein DIT68_09630 [Brumimicrobium oceani]
MIFLIVQIPFFLHSQEKGTLKFDLDVGFRNYQMDELNQRINDTSYIESFLYEELIDVSINKGIGFGLFATYQPFKLFNLGLYGSFQSGLAERDLRVILYQFDPFTSNDTLIGKRTNEVYSMIFGITSEFLIHNLDFWKHSTFLSRIESTVKLNGGYSKAKMFWSDQFLVNNNTIKRIYKSNGFHLAASLKLGFTILKNPIFSNIGFSMGYQYLQTSNLQSVEGAFFPEESNKTNLDFSGITAGLYLTVGK